ncbi:hypothetical protein [Parapedobacter sp. DT-150]|uniref:hypothetical protein n=1 Tax=Parapedobacter sp. DT-150 TaxID=3396162 RepID=UPI003F1966C6
MNTNWLYSTLLKLYNTIKRNAFYILLSLLVPMILWKVQVGRDIIVSLAEPGGRNYLNIPLLMASFSMLTISNWVIPVSAIDLWKMVVRRRVKSQLLYSELVSLYNGNVGEGNGQFPIRYFASLPWVILLYVTVYSFFPSRPLIAVGILVALVGGVVLIDWRYRGKRVPMIFQRLWEGATERGYSDKTRAMRYVATMGAIVVLFLVFVGVVGWLLRNNRGGLIGLVIGANAVAILLGYAYMKFAEHVDARGTDTSYFASKYVHLFALAFMLVIAVVLQCSNSSGWPVEIGFFSPIFILIIAISLYLFLADVFITAQLNITWIYNRDPAAYAVGEGGPPAKPVWAWYSPMVRLLAIALIFLFFFNSANSHRIRKHQAAPDQAYAAAARPRLTDYFDQWAKRRVQRPGDTLDVYLISGQGGGSRAAIWFFMAMNYLDSVESAPGHRFADQVFSISTVSGSTSGAAMYLADRYLDVPPQAASVVPRLKTIYARNYLSSSFWGVLIGDSFEGIAYEIGGLFGRGEAFPKDRNYYFQREEVSGYAKATPSQSAEAISRFFESDYLAPYRAVGTEPTQMSDSMSFSTALPLFFINSAIVERGERGVFSPVDMSDFSLGTDLYSLFKAYHPQYNIPLVACVNQSQAFPVINAYNYLDGAGRLIDGGIYENSGTTTTLEIYQALKKHLETKWDIAYPVRLICINVVNTNMDGTKDNVRFRPASVLNTLTAAVQSPFGGHEQFSYRNILRQVSAPDTAYPFPLNRPIPLTRMLPSTAVDTMYVALQQIGAHTQK